MIILWSLNVLWLIKSAVFYIIPILWSVVCRMYDFVEADVKFILAKTRNKAMNCSVLSQLSRSDENKCFKC